MKSISTASSRAAENLAADESRLKKIFRKYDDDGSGSIDGDELYNLLRDLG
jgi:Ca2+-binding EF-hand superfamily protein